MLEDDAGGPRANRARCFDVLVVLNRQGRAANHARDRGRKDDRERQDDVLHARPEDCDQRHRQDQEWESLNAIHEALDDQVVSAGEVTAGHADDRADDCAN